MRLIFEEIDREYFLEVILDCEDLDNLIYSEGVVQEYFWDDRYITDINVFVRKEGIRCHWLKGKKLELEKDSAKIFEEKLTQESLKSRRSPLLIRKRDKGKKRLPRKKGQSNGESDSRNL